MDELASAQNSGVAELARRLGPVDEAQIRLLLQVSPAQRIQTMLDMQAVILNGWRTRLRRAYPDLSNLELCRLIFERLQKND